MADYPFPEWTDKFKRLVGLMVLGGPIYLVAILAYGQTPEAIRIGYRPVQPVPYSHALHAGELGIDCRYCHNTVDQAASAAIPPAATCMNCHTTILPDSELLEPVRRSAKTGSPIVWARVHDLPDYVYFNHSAHVTRGVGCESCHGRVDQMDVVYQHAPLTMSWCLDCHRAPEKVLRNPADVTVMGYVPPGGDQVATGRRLRTTDLGRCEPTEEDPDKCIHNPPTNCSTCHR